MPHIRVQGGSTRVVCGGWKAHEVRPKCTGTWGGREGMRRTGREREREKSGLREARAVACRRALVIYVPSLHHLRVYMHGNYCYIGQIYPS